MDLAASLPAAGRLRFLPVFPVSVGLCPAWCLCLDRRQTPVRRVSQPARGTCHPHGHDPLPGSVWYLGDGKLPFCQRPASPYLRICSVLRSNLLQARDIQPVPGSATCPAALTIVSPSMAEWQTVFSPCYSIRHGDAARSGSSSGSTSRPTDSRKRGCRRADARITEGESRPTRESRKWSTGHGTAGVSVASGVRWT